ncbi:hypothetical protein HDU84_002185 [Entophlyctis sp. JEL0112]|nr:hypothetical protein HDU84_002185 [Entophlyctis sp. JEL0112]
MDKSVKAFQTSASPFLELRRQHLRNMSVEELHDRLDALNKAEKREIDEIMQRYQRDRDTILNSRGSAQ